MTAGDTVQVDRATMSFTDDHVTSRSEHPAPTFRWSYEIVGGSADRFVLELTDDAGATTITELTMVPCGMAVRNRRDCQDEFCRNVVHTTIREMVQKAGITDPEEVARHVQAVSEHVKMTEGAPELTYYRRVRDPE